MPILQILIFLLGFFIVIGTLLSAVRTFVVPRSQQDFLSRVVFVVVRFFFNLANKTTRTYAARDSILAFYAPIALLMLVPVWLALITFGYACMFWVAGAPTGYEAFRESGSALLTLGFAPVDGLIPTLMSFTEAMLGLILIALLIAYLPSIYSAFQRRELAVTLLEVRAGSPPSAVEMIERFHRIHGFDRLTEMWQRWEEWFAEIEESHTSLAALVFFRSPVPRRHWVTAAGAVLDGAALAASTLDLPRNPQAELCIRAGFLALRAIADFFNFPYDSNPKPTDPISITRAEYDAVYNRLASEGIPIKPDRDQAWRDFAGWRVNYDSVLLALAQLTQAPVAPWSSDRAPLRLRDFFRKR
jgi:hypothetical protein